MGDLRRRRPAGGRPGAEFTAGGAAGFGTEPGLAAQTARALLFVLKGSGFVVVNAALQGHLIAHAAQVEIQRPLHLVVFKGLTGRLERREPLAHQAAGSTLLPLEHLFKAQAGSPLALLGEVAVMLRTIDPIEAALIVDEMAIAALADACHGPRSLVILH